MSGLQLSGLCFKVTDYRQLISEESKIRVLRDIVDECSRKLEQVDLADSEADAIIEKTRRKVLGLFSGKEEQFELIYRPRFKRILEEKLAGKKG